MAGSRDLEWAGCYDVRDLGGLPTRGGGTTRPAAVVRADSLDRAHGRGMGRAARVRDPASAGTGPGWWR